jgi:hypothetical protein
MYAYDPNKGYIVPVEMLEQEGDDAECDANGLTDCADLS